MNLETHNYLLSILNEKSIKEYNEKLDSIVWDYKNMIYLYKFCTGDGDSTVISAIDDYVCEKFQLEDDDEITIDLLVSLANYHGDYFVKTMETFYNTFFDFEYSMECIKYNGKDKLNDSINDMFDKLDSLRIVAVETSDFFLNYCAIHFYKHKLNGQYDKEKVMKNIRFNYNGFFENTRSKIELFNVIKKLDRLVTIYNGKEPKKQTEFSMFDYKASTKRSLEKQD